MSALCSLADVKTYLGWMDGNRDAVISALIPAASGFIESYCDRVFLQASYTETRNGNGGSRLFLRNGPVSAVASVTVDGLTVPAATNAVTFGYVFDDLAVYIREGGYPGRFNRGVQNVTVAYTAGFAAIPPEVNQACVELIAFKLAKRDRIDKKNEVLAQQTVGFDMSDMPAGAKTLLAQYRRVSTP